MKSEHYVLSKFANEIAEQISRKTIFGLQGIKETLSGDAWDFNNSWDDICAQFQSGLYN